MYLKLAVITVAFLLNMLTYATASTMPRLVESFSSPGAASQLHYSSQYGLLFLRNSGSAVRVIDTATRSQISLQLANQQFTDMDLSLDGKYLYVADWGRVSIGYGTLVNPHYVHRFNLVSRLWETKESSVDTYKLEAVGGDRVVLLESDQWVGVNLMQWGTEDSMTHLAYAPADYYGDIEFDAETGRLYHGNSGSSSREISVLRLVGDSFSFGVGTGIYGSAQNGGGTSVLSLDGERFYYGRLQVEALDVTNNIRTFPNSIYAATSELAFGSNTVYDAVTGTVLGSFGFNSTAYAFDKTGNELWAYSDNMLYHYSLGVPEPSSVMIGLLGIVICSQHRRTAQTI